MTHLKPMEILNVTMDSAVIKARSSLRKLIILSVLAGAFIAIAGAGANMAGYFFLADPSTTGLGKMISGLIFPPPERQEGRAPGQGGTTRQG